MNTKQPTIKLSNIIFPIFLFTLSFLFLYHKTVWELIGDWYHDENYSHGFLIPLISGYMIWQKRDNLKQLKINPSNSGVLILLFGFGLYLIGYLAGESFTMRFSMIVVLTGTIIYTLGMEIFRELLFPVSYLVFMIPLPYLIYNSIAFPLKLLVSKYSVWFLQLIGIPVYREGNVIYLTNITLEVINACSGIRSLISLLALSTAIGYFYLNTNLKRAVLILLSVPIAILVNSLRIIITGILSNLYGSALARGFFHEFEGVVLFGFSLFFIFFASWILKKV